MRAADRAVMFSSASQEWETPAELFDRYNVQHGFTLDVCASAVNAKVPRHFDRGVNGLIQPWAPERCWMNPPYGRGDSFKWVTKAASEAEAGALVVALLPARTDTRWWHYYIWDGEGPRPGVTVEFLRGRVKFVGAAASAPFPSVVVTFWPERRKAEEAG